VFHITWFRAVADGSISTGTKLGVAADRVGNATDTNAAFSAAAPYTSASGGSPRSAPSSSRLDANAWPAWAHTKMRRRSTRSITGPMSSETTTIGTSCTSPTAPTAALEPVRSNTWTNSATRVICVPVCETTSPHHSSRKSRDARSGARSTAKRRTRRAARDTRNRIDAVGVA
jgi:hypothetical protein